MKLPSLFLINPKVFCCPKTKENKKKTKEEVKAKRLRKNNILAEKWFLFECLKELLE
jgi:hypothetical protein